MSKIAKKYGMSKFEDLQTSTRTVMVYSNINFNLPKVFEIIPIIKVEVPLTKKKKNVDKKKLKAPYGTVISVQRGNRYRGIYLRKKKNHWCTKNCRITERRGNKIIRRNTIIEERVPVKDTDIMEIKYYCTECNTYYTLKQLKKITNFLNQVTVVMSIGNILLNIMMFKDSIKIAGCKEETDASEAIMILWQDYIEKVKESWNIRPKFKTEDPSFLFCLVMRNVDFKLGFYIDRETLNRLMNDEKFSDKVFMSQCETTGHTNVNIKMYAKQPEDYTYDVLSFPTKKKPYMIDVEQNNYKNTVDRKAKYTTFIVFSSSEIILSGRYKENMKEMYYFFIKQAFENKKLIEEKLEKPNLDLLSHLSKK